MPVLEPTDPVFSGLPKDFGSVLPGSQVTNGQVVNLFRQIKEDSFGAESLENADNLSAQIARRTATTIGWPGAQLDALGGVVATYFEQIPPAAIDQAFAGALPELLKEVQQAIGSALTGVPIVGWLLGLTRFVFQLVEVLQAQSFGEASIEALAYDKEADNDAVKYVLDRAGGADWTAIFSPPAGPWSSAKLAYSASGVADGFAWGQLVGDSGSIRSTTEGQLGFLPGVAQMAGYWQSPRKAPGSERPAGFESILAGNQLLPATTALSGLLWTNSQKPGPTLGAVDLGGVADAWGQYGDALEAFASSQEGQIVKQIRNGWMWYVPELGDRALYSVRPSDVPQKWRANRLENLIAYQLEKASKRIYKNLGTIACAYVGPDAPALRDDSLHDRWSEMRARLLGHSARADVDLELVPDAAYRAALAAAQKSPSASLTSTPAKVHAFQVTLDGDAVEEPEVPALPGDGPQRVAGDSDGPGGAIVAGIVIFLLSRRGRR